MDSVCESNTNKLRNMTLLYMREVGDSKVIFISVGVDYRNVWDKLTELKLKCQCEQDLAEAFYVRINPFFCIFLKVVASGAMMEWSPCKWLNEQRGSRKVVLVVVWVALLLDNMLFTVVGMSVSRDVTHVHYRVYAILSIYGMSTFPLKCRENAVIENQWTRVIRPPFSQ